jgi:radical SAM superfamily enzyme YgiQ (UPF0313 family)
MAVLLVSLNTERLPDPVFPLGLACLAGALTRAGRTYRVHDLLFEDTATLVRAVAAPDVEAICLSLRNLDNVAYPRSVSYLDDYRRLARALAPVRTAPLILGGSAFSLYPDLLMRELVADYGVIGAGEGPLTALLSALEAGGDPAAVPNLLIRSPQGLRRTGRVAQPLPDTRPDRRGFPVAAYEALGGMANVQTKRGCPFGCIYCSYPVIEGRTALARPMPEVLAELRELAEAGSREVFFTDSVLNHPPGYAKALAAGIIETGLDIAWTCYASPLGFDRETAELFVASGCLGLEFGTDALCDPMLAALGKPFTTDQVRRASLACAEAGLPCCHAVLVGGPGETPASLTATVEALAAIPATAVIFMTGIRIIPDTALHAIAIREGVVAPDDPLLEPAFYLSREVAPLFPDLARRLARTHRNWVFPGHAIRYDADLAGLLRRRGARGPLWLSFAR